MTSVQLIARKKEWSIGKSTVFFRMVLGKEKLNSVVISTELYQILSSIYSILGREEKETFLLLLWTVAGGRVLWQEFSCV